MLQRFILCMLLVGISHNSLTMDFNNQHPITNTTETSTISSSSSTQSIRKSKRKFHETTTEIITQKDSSSTSESSLNSQIPFKMEKAFPYNPQRKSNLYNPSPCVQNKISRSKLDNFLTCPTCFYLNVKLGLTPPPGYPFSLNNAVDAQQKKTFDLYRTNQEPHPLCVQEKINAIPFQHKDMNKWQDSLHHGMQADIEGTNITLQGGIDDMWENPTTKELHVVDYKATSKKGEVTIDAPWQEDYKHQVEVYQAIGREKQLPISDRAYFVYSNAQTDTATFDDKLDFKTKIIPYDGNSSWVKPAVVKAYEYLQADTIPSDALSNKLSQQCALCLYFQRRTEMIAANNNK